MSSAPPTWGDRPSRLPQEGRGGRVPEPMWIAGRRQVLEKFLARPSVYASPQFRSRCEAAARANLTRALDALVKQ